MLVFMHFIGTQTFLMQKVHVIPIMSPPRRPAKQARSSSTGQVGEAFCFPKKDVTATDHSDAQDDLLDI